MVEKVKASKATALNAAVAKESAVQAKQTAVQERSKVRGGRRVDEKGCCAYHPDVRITKPGKMYGFKDEGALCYICESEESDAIQAEGRAAEAERRAAVSEHHRVSS